MSGGGECGMYDWGGSFFSLYHPDLRVSFFKAQSMRLLSGEQKCTDAIIKKCVTLSIF